VKDSYDALFWSNREDNQKIVTHTEPGVSRALKIFLFMIFKQLLAP
jgi:hypothetical protein